MLSIDDLVAAVTTHMHPLLPSPGFTIVSTNPLRIDRRVFVARRRTKSSSTHLENTQVLPVAASLLRSPTPSAEFGYLPESYRREPVGVCLGSTELFHSRDSQANFIPVFRC